MAAATKLDAALTGPQAEVHRFMLRYQREHGLPPTVREIGVEFGYSSPNGTMCHIKALIKKGYAKRLGEGLRRAFVAIDRDAPLCGCCGQPLATDGVGGSSA